MILAVAWARHEAACEPYREGDWSHPDLVKPFGTPYEMPPHRWRVSRDMLQALYNASPPPIGPNPKNGDDGTLRLYGWSLDVDKNAPNGTMLLEAMP